MIESDLELVEKQSAAKGWLQRIATEGILEFGSGGSLICDTGISPLLNDFTFAFIGKGRMDSDTRIIFETSTAATNFFSLSMSSTNGFWFQMNFGSTVQKIAQPIKSLDSEDMYIIVSSIDRDGNIDVYNFNLDNPSQLWGYNAMVDISDQSANSIIAAKPASFCLDTDTFETYKLDLFVNRVMTSEEIHAYVSGIGSPNSLPEDLRGVGDLETGTVGQIFSCRPHRDGIHTDDTGNGYNWTNVGSPVIKPFSAGIR